MNGTQEKEANDSQDSRTINIEIPSSCLKGMFRMMAGLSYPGKGKSGCCEMPRVNCYPQPEESGGGELNIVIKMKGQPNESE